VVPVARDLRGRVLQGGARIEVPAEICSTEPPTRARGSSPSRHATRGRVGAERLDTQTPFPLTVALAPRSPSWFEALMSVSECGAWRSLRGGAPHTRHTRDRGASPARHAAPTVSHAQHVPTVSGGWDAVTRGRYWSGTRSRSDPMRTPST
jgi:hypothetical protein